MKNNWLILRNPKDGSFTLCDREGFEKNKVFHVEALIKELDENLTFDEAKVEYEKVIEEETKKEYEKIIKENIIMHTLTEIVKGTKVKFKYFNSFEDRFTYTVSLEDGTVYSFVIDRSDVGNASLFSEDKALIFMRWIRKSISEGKLRHNVEAETEGDFIFSFYRAGFIYYKGIFDGKETEVSFDVTDKGISSLYENVETADTIQQWLQQAQVQQGQSED